MASTSKEPLDRDDSPDGEYVVSERLAGRRRDAEDVSQLNLFETLPAAGAETAWLSPARDRGEASFPDLPLVETISEKLFSAAKRRPDAALPGAADPAGFATVRGARAGRGDAVDARTSDAEDLRRIEESIRWLVSAGATPMPRPASLPSVRSLVPLDDSDSLLLDPETLFPPRLQRRRGNVTAGMVRLLLVGAVAAPTAYFIADWMQFPRMVATSESAAVSATVSTAEATVAPSDSGQNAAAATVVAMPVPQPVNDVVPPQQTTHEGEVAKAPADPPPATRVVALTADQASAAVPPVASEPPPAVAPPPVETTVPPPPPAVAPVNSAAGSEEIARMVERGRILFEAGDLASARLVFRRAANAGDAAAAIAMGATYDPEVLTQRFIRGIEANPAEAQRWYERAREMGQHRTAAMAEGH